MTIKLAPLLLLPLLLSACAAGAPKTVATGPGPSPSSDYRVASATPEAVPIAPLIEARLQALGLKPASEAAKGRYLVELSYGERPTNVGVHDQAAPPPTVEDPAWRVAPARRQWWKDPDLRACRLTVRISETATGREIYRVETSARRRKTRCAEAAPALVQAALPAVPLSPAP